MKTSEILAALLAFIIGLLSKFVYDLWAESRQKKTIHFTKKVLNSFSVDLLGEKLRERAEVLFDKTAIKSVHIVSVEIENVGHHAVKNQAFTVRFSDNAQILGTPTSKSSSEDLRYIHGEQVVAKQNAYRFIVDLLQTRRKISWEFVVINSDTKDFVIEHGISPKNADFSDSDLDVDSTVATSKIELDLISQIKRTFFLTFWLITLILFVDPITNVLGNISLLVLRVISVFLLYLLINAISRVIQLYIENRSVDLKKNQLADIQVGSIDVGGNLGNNLIIGNSNTILVPIPDLISTEPGPQIIDAKPEIIENKADSQNLLSESKE